LRKLLGWNLGDVLSIDVRDGVLIVQPVTMPKCPTVTRYVATDEVAS
jgi:bifunctional DNA-binding transcriptional regulator/antitoxin component of YhaV-PrlF toxin-antitoxin module